MKKTSFDTVNEMSKRTKTNMADNCQNHMGLTCIQLVGILHFE